MACVERSSGIDKGKGRVGAGDRWLVLVAIPALVAGEWLTSVCKAKFPSRYFCCSASENWIREGFGIGKTEFFTCTLCKRARIAKVGLETAVEVKLRSSLMVRLARRAADCEAANWRDLPTASGWIRLQRTWTSFDAHGCWR